MIQTLQAFRLRLYLTFKRPINLCSCLMFFYFLNKALSTDWHHQVKPIGKTDTMVATKIGGVASVGIGVVSYFSALLADC